MIITDQLNLETGGGISIPQVEHNFRVNEEKLVSQK